MGDIAKMKIALLFANVATASAAVATYFRPGTPSGGSTQGSCGWQLSNPETLGWVSLGPIDGHYSPGHSYKFPMCGKKVYGWRSVGSQQYHFEGTIANACTECEKDHLDLTLGAYNSICPDKPSHCYLYWKYEGANETRSMKAFVSN